MTIRNFLRLVFIGLSLAACAGEPPSPTPTRLAAGSSTTPGASSMPEPTRTPAPSQGPPPTVAVSPTSTPIPFPAFDEAVLPLALAPEQLERLYAVGVVAGPGSYPEFHDLYLETFRANLPIFVTSDALLHVWHLTFDQTLRSLEESVFLPDLQAMNRLLLARTAAQYTGLQGTAWEDAARRAYAFVAVGAALADPATEIPPEVADLASAELALIMAAGGFQASPLFPLLALGEDYSQYIPRGHYTLSDSLTSYFRSMMWYGRMTFRLGDPVNPDVGPTETRIALLLALALRDAAGEDATALELWDNLYDPTAYLVGRSDDLTVKHYLDLMDQVYGPGSDLGLVADDALLQTFIEAAMELPPPRILGLISADFKPISATQGMRLMGQRFVPDAYIFQNLIHPEVPERWLPSGLDVMAVLGSERAALWLAEDPNTSIPEYPVKFAELVEWTAGLTPADWSETAYNSWLYSLLPLLEPPTGNLPPFMQSSAWQDKQLNTALGSFAELKHDTILYAKQAYGGLGGGGHPNPPRPRQALAYLEPVPEVYARIAATIAAMRADLEARGLLQRLPLDENGQPELAGHLVGLENIALAYQGIAEKELAGQALSSEEMGRLRGFGEYLENIVRWVTGEKPEFDPAAVIADVATDPNTQRVLEVGVGAVHELYVAAPIVLEDGTIQLTVARGGIFSYYEFASPDRLTDEAWREMLAAGEQPAQPAYTTGFSLPQSAPLDVQAVIYGFQLDWAGWLYYTSGFFDDGDFPVVGYFTVPVSSEVEAQAQAEVDRLVAAREYEGRQWLFGDYLSVEPVEGEPGRLRITVRETWEDYLVTYTGENPFSWWDLEQQDGVEPITARRGPYSVDVAYELEPEPNDCKPGQRFCYRWRVVSVTELTARPDWEE